MLRWTGSPAFFELWRAGPPTFFGLRWTGSPTFFGLRWTGPSTSFGLRWTGWPTLSELLPAGPGRRSSIFWSVVGPPSSNFSMMSTLKSYPTHYCTLCCPLISFSINIFQDKTQLPYTPAPSLLCTLKYLLPGSFHFRPFTSGRTISNRSLVRE